MARAIWTDRREFRCGANGRTRARHPATASRGDAAGGRSSALDRVIISHAFQRVLFVDTVADDIRSQRSSCSWKSSVPVVLMAAKEVRYEQGDGQTRLSADEALAFLIEGNNRFGEGHGRAAAFRRETQAELVSGQHPYATILGCSDSRVAPEWIFDAGLGELFIVRVAGNILSPENAGSLQYAGSHLRTPLFVVLGHEGCGAISAALAAKHEGV